MRSVVDRIDSSRVQSSAHPTFLIMTTNNLPEDIQKQHAQESILELRLAECIIDLSKPKRY